MSVMDRVRLVRWKAYFLFLIAMSQSFVHHWTNDFAKALFSGWRTRLHPKDLFQKVDRSVVNLLKKLSIWSRTLR